MKKFSAPVLLSLPLALILACGSADAQLKAPASSQPNSPLGSGLYAPAAPVTPPAGAETPTAEAIIQEIAGCLVAGLPQDWTRAQIEVVEIGRDGKARDFEAIYSYLGAEGKGARFSPCDPREPALNLYKLNGALSPEKRDWIKATMIFSKEGAFELQYDYPKKDTDSDAQSDAGNEAKSSVKSDSKKGAKSERGTKKK